VKLELVFQTVNDIGRCFPFKGGHTKHMQSCAVYHLKCSNFNVDYIGKTSRQVKRRFEEHKSGSQKDETYDSACFDHEKTLIIKLITKITKFQIELYKRSDGFN
jgi:predicted GIY-YIG superfamily endonuclease